MTTATTPPQSATAPSGRLVLSVALFALTLFVSAALLFLVQPMVGKMILPKFGGVPAVWNTCLVFFQAALLAGYGYAHVSGAWLGVRRQAAVHAVLLLLPLFTLPISVAAEWAPRADAHPVVPLLGLLLVSVGLPFFVIATSAPVLQRWFAAAGQGRWRDPYFLYAASNTGSLLALVAYPALIEPALSLRQQGWLWAGAYGALLVLTGACAVLVWRSGKPSVGEEAATGGSTPGSPIGVSGVWPRLRWVVLAFVPSSMLLGVTTYLTTEIAPIPLLWVAPLVLYLLTFILAFSRLPPAFHRTITLALPLVLLFQAFAAPSHVTVVWRSVALHLLTFFVAAMACHGELARRRPPVAWLTEFYLWVSLGGVLGGLFNGLLAPALFNSVVEYPLGLVLAALLLPPLWPARGRLGPRLNRGLPWLLAATVAGGLFWRDNPGGNRGLLLHQERTFFSILQVRRGTAGRMHEFAHGNIRHGLQIRSDDPRQRRLPLVYYFPTGPIGQVFQSLGGPQAKDRVAVIGLGIGTLASYGETGQEFTFFEIDPAVKRIARDPQYFSYLADAEARGVRVRTVLGDARLSLQREPQGRYGLLVVDAFTGDSIPTHLLTGEAVRLYLERLTDDGLLAFHITNDYLDLGPVLGDAASAAGLVGLIQNDAVLSVEEQRRGKAHSTWVVLARHPAAFGPLPAQGRWKPLAGRPGARAWTDDYSNVLGTLRWN
jgi:hypothetical protein